MAHTDDPLESWQIITGDKEFRDVQEYLIKSGIASNGFNYNVVSVFGSQSTGKSTLLNKLFGTRFATMDTVSRQQTTKGIWISRAVDSDILVMDVEGTDGRERGDDQDFERKSALFSIATSEVLVVNMWETQVGLYNGANMGLLKTVFEVNLQLFQSAQAKKERSLLLFVIRDHLGTTPLDNLATTITADLEKMWNALLKPTQADSSAISDYFDFRFVGLPHKVLMQQAFDESVSALRKSFDDKSTGTGIFKQEYHKRIPADGFSQYAKGIWEAIEANKDLDLPSQQELLAQFRCDEIATSAMSAFESRLGATEKLMVPGTVYDRLGAEMSLALSDALAIFDTDASRYHNSVYIKKRADLLAAIDARLYTLFKSQLAAKRKVSLQDYEKSVRSELQGKSYDFNALTTSKGSAIQQDFLTEAQSCRIEPMTWSIQEDISLLDDDISEITARLRLEESKRVHDQIYKALKVNFEEIVPEEFNKLDLTLWDRILDACMNRVLKQSKDRLSSRLDALSLPQPEIEKSDEDLDRRAWRLLRARVGEETTESHLLLKLREHFEDSFKFDSEGVPIVWKAGDNIDLKYRSARENTLNLIPVFSRIQRADGSTPKLPPADSGQEEDDDFTSDTLLRILSPSKQTDVTTRFKKIADAIYIDAKRSTVSSVASVPLYFYGLLLILGWNELMALLRNPLYFMTIIFAALVAYSVYTLNLSGPVEQVARAMLGTMFDIVRDKLRSALEISQESVPELMHNNVSAGSGSNSRRSQSGRKEIHEDIAMDNLTTDGKKYD